MKVDKSREFDIICLRKEILMADFYTQFSFELKDLTVSEVNYLTGKKVEGIRISVDPYYENDRSCVWIRSDSDIDMEEFVDFLHGVFTLIPNHKDKSLKEIGFEYSFSCSRLSQIQSSMKGSMLLDSFGGGCYYICEKGIHHRTTNELLCRLQISKM